MTRTPRLPAPLAQAPWLLDPSLLVCVVGSSALAEACRRAGVAPAPRAGDLDLSWVLSVEDGQALLQQHGVWLPTTPASRERGTLAMKIGDHRIEITTLRAGEPGLPPRQRIEADLGARDMTVGAVAWWLEHDQVLDPHHGVEDWQHRRVVPVGDVDARVAEHPVRWLRYYRRAHEWGFELDRSVRRLALPGGLLAEIPPEAIAQELRAALLRCPSPGRLLLELHEAGLLAVIAPALDAQMDGRPAGPQRHHPEVSQALHLILALEWISERAASLPDVDRAAVAIAVLCHDLGKSTTPAHEWPAHRGHEGSGLQAIDALIDRLPGLADAFTRRLAKAVCELHLLAPELRGLRPGTVARLYDRHFRPRAFRADLFALAVGADRGGRLGLADRGDAVAAQVAADIAWVRERCASVDAARLRAEHTDDGEFKAALHEARARALKRAD